MFFTREKIKSIEIEKRYKKTNKRDCEDCKLYKNCTSPKMPPTGKNEKNIYILAECPGTEEDKRNTQLIGPSGQLLREYLNELDIDLDNDCLKDNSCRCFASRTPTNKEINCCRNNILNTIKEIKPEKIILLGKTALLSFLGARTTDIGSVSKWAGFKIPDQLHNCWIFPTFHPSYVLRDIDNIPLVNLFKQHLKTAFTWNKPFPINKFNIILLDNLNDTLTALRAIKMLNRPIVFDYETTGLKPHKKGHKILCMSISCEPYQAYTFPFFENKEFLNLVKDILTSPKIGKVAHNIKFENTWTKFILGHDVVNWISDTMMTAHEIDNRTGITGLKFQAYVNYGVLGYNIDITIDENGFNTLHEVPIKELLTYCGMDSLFTYLLYYDQKKTMRKWSKNRKKTHKLFLDTIKTFAQIEQKGFIIKPEYYKQQNIHLGRRIERLKRKIQNSKEVQLYGSHFNLESTVQLRELLFDILEYKSDKKTKKGLQSADQSVLKELNTEFTNMLLEYKKLYKLKNTYLAGFIREVVNNKIYPVNNLNLTRTFRSSVNSPNYQNIPMREEEAKRITRSGIVPRKGHQIVGVDYGKIEVCTGACAHKDPVMLKYLNNPSTDMHRDMAMEIFLLKENQVTPNIRHAGKNEFVFPQFYGAYYGSCAANLWKTANEENTADDVLLRIHLSDNNIITFDDFETHIAEIEHNFWHKRFKVYTKWRDYMWDFYQKNGYIESLDGCIFSGLMDKRQVWDYTIQCTACHCLLWSMIELSKYLKDSYILGQIHDELLFDVNPEELDDLIPIIKKLMCEDIKDYFKWLIVPLTIEITVTEIDGNWYDKKKLNFFQKRT